MAQIVVPRQSSGQPIGIPYGHKLNPDVIYAPWARSSIVGSPITEVAPIYGRDRYGVYFNGNGTSSAIYVPVGTATKNIGYTIVWAGTVGNTSDCVPWRDNTSVAGSGTMLRCVSGALTLRVGSVDYTLSSNSVIAGAFYSAVLSVGSNVVLAVNRKQLLSSSTRPTTDIVGPAWGMFKNSAVAGNYYSGKCHLFAVYEGSIPDGFAVELSGNPWQLFTPQKRIIYFPVSSGGSTSVQQDSLFRWNLIEALQSNSSLRWNVATSTENNQSVRWNILEGTIASVSLSWNLAASVQANVIPRWNALSSSQQDTLIRWNTATSAQQDIQARWDVLSTVLSAQGDVALRWNMLSAAQQDILARWNIALAVEQALATRWNLLNAAQVSASARWNIAAAVTNDILARWDIAALASAQADLSITWALLAVSENTIELRWSIGDATTTPSSRIFLVRGEDRVYSVSPSGRKFGVH